MNTIKEEYNYIDLKENQSNNLEIDKLKAGYLPYKEKYPNGKRKRIENLLIHECALNKFNSTLLELDPDFEEINSDQISSATRWMKKNIENENNAIDFIKSRISWYEAILWIYNNPHWEAPYNQQSGAEKIVHYFKKEPHIIPDDYPKIGMLDKSIFLNELESFLRPLIKDYLDFKLFCYKNNLKMENTPAREWLNYRILSNKRQRDKKLGYTYTSKTNLPDRIKVV